MKALQLHYTSCRRGLSGSAGFQFRSLSPGITSEEQREIERRGVYRSPRDVQEDATSGPRASDYPVAFRFYTLESGRQALTRSCYSGRDYSGRQGNYFAHTLVFDCDSTLPWWPVDFYEWPQWHHRLEPAEDTEETPPSLATVDLGEIEPAESFRLEEISEFLREEPGREELLACMGRAVLLGLEDSRALVIRDTPANNPFWVASIQKLFPPQHATSLSFSSYQDDPRDCATVNATTGETDFTFSDAERRFQFYVFDLTTGRHSEVSDGSDYPATVARWLAQDPRELERFFEFMQLFEHRTIEPELLAALDLFRLAREQDQSPGGEKLVDMVRFANRWASPEGRVQLIELIGDAVERLGGLRRVEDYEVVIRFLAEGGAATGRPRHRELAFGVWQSLLDDQIVGRGRGLEVAQNSWRILTRELKAHRGEWASRMLETSRWNEWQDQVPRLDSEVLIFLLSLTRHALSLADRGSVWEQTELALVVQALVGSTAKIDRGAQLALQAMPATAESLAAICRLASHQRSNSERVAVGRALGRVLGHADESVARATRLRLDDTEGWDFLFGEWMELLESAEKPQTMFRQYSKTVLTAVPGYGQEYSSTVGESLLDHLPEAEGMTLALDWLGANTDRFSESLLRRCLELANRGVDLDLRSRAGGRAARRVSEVATRQGVELRPDRPALRRALSRIGRVRTEKDLDLRGLKLALEGIEAEDYQFFLKSFLRPGLELTGAKNEHRRVLLALLRSEHAMLFDRAYRDFFRSQRKARWSESLQGALKLWLELAGTNPSEQPLARFQKTALSELERLLGRLSERRYEEVRKKVRPRQELVAVRWQEVQDNVETRRQGPLARLKGFFFRKKTT